MKKSLLFALKKIAPALLLSTAMQASAALVTTTHSGFGAGTLDGVEFVGSFVITATADTSTITALEGGGYSNQNISVLINIESLAPLTFITPTSYVSTEDGVAFTRVDGTSLFDGPTSATTWDWDMASTSPLLTGYANLLQWGDGLQTSGGTLVFYDGLTPSGFVAIAEVSEVPIPAGVWLFGSGVVGLVGIARRKAA